MPNKFELQKIAVPAVILLIAFLSYSSQFLFLELEPGPLSQAQQWKFNVLVGCIWISYFRSITVDPGRVPNGWGVSQDVKGTEDLIRQRFCRKCQAAKPPRSHHCKVCKRCIPKMDHHCPWTSNCVSHFTFPHFMRFLFYAVTSMTYLERFLWTRIAVVWNNRHLPSYLGPTATQMSFLFILILANTITLIAVTIMFLRSGYDMFCNTTTIETWEVERHEQLLRRARALGGYLDGPDGIRIKIKRQEFPYDIGIWANLCQGMGSANPVSWLWPLSATPKSDGLSFETNGFEDPGTSWPPPDPDRMPRLQRDFQQESAFIYGNAELTPQDEMHLFKQRQQQDYQERFGVDRVVRRKAFHDRFDSDTYKPLRDADLNDDEGSGEEGWQDSGGSRLRDYGVDEETEFYDDEIPLAELIRRRGMAQNDSHKDQ